MDGVGTGSPELQTGTLLAVLPDFSLSGGYSSIPAIAALAGAPIMQWRGLERYILPKSCYNKACLWYMFSEAIGIKNFISGLLGGMLLDGWPNTILELHRGPLKMVLLNWFIKSLIHQKLLPENVKDF